jgi:hypothetical protein
VIAGLDVSPRAQEPIAIHERKIHTFRDCNPKSYTLRFPAREISEKEKRKLILPYLETNFFKTVQLGYPTGKTKSGISYLEDSQMIFAIDLSPLPVKQDLISIDSFTLKMTTHRLVNTGDPRSGMLCLIKEKICSGDFAIEKSKRANINSAFFNGKEPPNDYFIRSMQGPESPEGIVTANLNLPLNKLIENSTTPDQLDILYSILGEKTETLYFAVARNIYILKNVHLEASVTISSCITSDTITTEEGP